MILGIGIDIVDISRVERLCERHEKWASRLLTPRESACFSGTAERRWAEFLAGRFAAKEAAAKALGTGIGKAVGFHDLEILPDEAGKPRLVIADRVRNALFPSVTELHTHVSIAHERTYAMAQVILEQR